MPLSLLRRYLPIPQLSIISVCRLLYLQMFRLYTVPIRNAMRTAITFRSYDPANLDTCLCPTWSANFSYPQAPSFCMRPRLPRFVCGARLVLSRSSYSGLPEGYASHSPVDAGVSMGCSLDHARDTGARWYVVGFVGCHPLAFGHLWYGLGNCVGITSSVFRCTELDPSIAVSSELRPPGFASAFPLSFTVLRCTEPLHDAQAY